MDQLPIKGRFQVEHRNAAGELLGQYDFPNGIVTEGIHHILSAEFLGGAQVTTWYIGLVNQAGFTSFNNADTMSSHTGWAEATAYSEGNRVEWPADSPAGRAITNSTTADFSINATVTLNGIFVTSNNTKSGTTGTLWSTASFASPVTANNGDTLKVTYSVTG